MSTHQRCFQGQPLVQHFALLGPNDGRRAEADRDAALGHFIDERPDTRHRRCGMTQEEVQCNLGRSRFHRGAGIVQSPHFGGENRLRRCGRRSAREACERLVNRDLPRGQLLSGRAFFRREQPRHGFLAHVIEHAHR